MVAQPLSYATQTRPPPPNTFSRSAGKALTTTPSSSRVVDTIESVMLGFSLSRADFAWRAKKTESAETPCGMQALALGGMETVAVEPATLLSSPPPLDEQASIEKTPNTTI